MKHNSMLKNYLLKHIESLQAKGRYSFTMENILQDIKIKKTSLQHSLQRLVKRNKIMSIRRGFYIIIPVEYSSQKILPAYHFIDDMMKVMKRPYYIGLLNAAAFYGASHQQPMETVIVTLKPSIKTISKRGVKISFICRNKLYGEFIEKRDTETGFIFISGPELTALDLVEFGYSIGGLNRVSTVLKEMMDKLDPVRLNALLKKTRSSSACLQRLGYLLEKVLHMKKLAGVVHGNLKKNIRRVPLESTKKSSGVPMNSKWMIIENSQPESEL